MTYSESVFTKAPVTLTCDVFTFDSSILTRSDEEGTFHDVPLEVEAAFREHGFHTAVYLTHGKDAEGEYQEVLSLKIYIRGEDFTTEWVVQHGTKVALGQWRQILIENPVTKVWEICS